VFFEVFNEKFLPLNLLPSFPVDDLYKAEVDTLGRSNGNLGNEALAHFIYARLNSLFPESLWMVNVYDPIGLFENHAVNGYHAYTYYHKFRYYGHNLVVARYAVERLDRSLNLDNIVGTENGNHALNALNSIGNKFGRPSWYCIHVVRRGSGLVSVTNIANGTNYLWKVLPNFIVTVIAPDVYSPERA